MIKPGLKNNPNSYTYTQLLVNFADGKPIAPDLVNFLYRHEKILSCYALDPALKYYLKPYHRKAAESHHSFLLPHEKLNPNEVTQLKRRLDIFLKSQGSHVEFRLTPEEFTLLKQAGYPELILYHGNQFLTGAPFHPGGIPHIIFFQWGNSFGVAKYVVMAEEKSLKSNVLIYFEDMQDRYLDQCVKDYIHKHQLELRAESTQLQQQLTAPKEMHHYSPYAIPTLTLSKYTERKDEK